MSRIRYQFQIYARGVTATSGSVSYTYQTSQFAHAPFVGGQTIRPAEAHVESTPWSVDLVDLSGTAVSANLASTAGRMHLLGRMARLRASHDSTASTAYQTVAVSRITDVSLGADVASYRLTLQDERWIERQTDIFTKSNTCMLIPSGLIEPFHNAPKSNPAVWRVRKVVDNLVCLEYLGILYLQGDTVAVTSKAIQVIVDDVKPDAVSNATTITSGNFNTVRWRNVDTATDYEVATFDSVMAGLTNNPVQPGPSFVGTWETNAEPLVRPFYVWVVWPTSQPAVPDQIRGYVYAPTHPPTPDFPLHVGGVQGVHPMNLWETIYTGAYSGSTSLSLRRSTAAFAALKADQSYGKVWLRITGPRNMATFIEDHLAAPYHVAPLVDSSGRLAPTSLRIPHSTSISVANLLTLGSSNCIAHPTWEHPSQEAINVLRFRHESYALVTGNAQQTAASLREGFRIWPVDGLGLSTATVEQTHDSVTLLGRRLRDVRFAGAVTRPPVQMGSLRSTGTVTPTIDELSGHLALNIFPRFGDGPIWSSVECMDSVDRTTRGRITPGTFVKTKVATLPNPATNARGSTRIMQVMSRDDRPDGPTLRLLDAGPNLAVLSAPSIAIAQSSADPRHTVIATVSSVPSGAQYQAQLALTSTASTSAPVSTASAWFPVKAANRSTSATVFARGQLPSGTRVWARVRSIAPQRIGSAWSAAASTVTDAIVAPTIASVGSVTAGTAIVKWSNGSTKYRTRLMVDAATSASLGAANTVAVCAPRTTVYTLVGLNANDSHRVGVQHVDGFGGVSPQDSTTFTTSTSYTSAPAMRGLSVVQGA